MCPQTAAHRGQAPAESCCQEGAEGAVQRPLMEENQSAGEATAQGELALDEEQVWASATGVLRSERW